MKQSDIHVLRHLSSGVLPTRRTNEATGHQERSLINASLHLQGQDGSLMHLSFRVPSVTRAIIHQCSTAYSSPVERFGHSSARPTTPPRRMPPTMSGHQCITAKHRRPTSTNACLGLARGHPPRGRDDKHDTSGLASALAWHPVYVGDRRPLTPIRHAVQARHAGERTETTLLTDN